MLSSVRLPLLFVILWSSAFIAFEYCSTKIEPATFVVVRATTTVVILIPVILFLKLPWPTRRKEILAVVVVGILMHGGYGGGSFAAIYHGINVGLCAIILSLQPALTVILSATFLGEKITLQKIAGILTGMIGVSIIILNGDSGHTSTLNLGGNPGFESGLLGISLCFISLLAIAIATIVQKRFCSKVSLLPGACIQFTSAAAFMLPIALTLETMEIKWDMSFLLGMGWLVVFISLGAMLILMALINRGQAGTVANLFYLVTPLVAIQAWILLDESLNNESLAGMAICTIGVIIVNYVPTMRETPAAA